MNDPEIIEKLEEIRRKLSDIERELSGIKYEVNWIPKFLTVAFFSALFGVWLALEVF